MSRKVNVAVVGATGAVGEAMLEILAQRKFPIDNLYLLASERSAGKTLLFDGKSLDVHDLSAFDFRNTDIALFSAGGSVSQTYAPIAASEGAVVIDNTSCFRYQENIPLVISEVNPQAIEGYTHSNIIANPNCSTMQMLVALKPLHDEAGIEHIEVCTYQAVSGSGKSAISELAGQTGELLNGRAIEPKVYPQQIAFNVLPHIDVFEENGFTREEMKMVWETKKIFANQNITVNPTAVRVPVFYGHSMAVHVRFKSSLSAQKAKSLLSKAPGVKVVDSLKGDKKRYPTALQAAGQDDVYVGRIRQALHDEKTLDLWIVADNIRKGAALNAVQIAEILFNQYL